MFLRDVGGPEVQLLGASTISGTVVRVAGGTVAVMGEGYKVLRGALVQMTFRSLFDPDQPKSNSTYKHLGGEGSGNFGHAGRPGEVGGSGPGGAEGGSSSRSVEGYHIREKFLADAEAVEKTFEKDITLVKDYEQRYEKARAEARAVVKAGGQWVQPNVDASGVSEAAERIRNAREAVTERFKQSLTLPKDEQVSIETKVESSLDLYADRTEKKIDGWAKEVSPLIEKHAFTKPGWAESDFGVQADVRVELGIRSNYSSGRIYLGKMNKSVFFHELGHQLEEGEGNRTACRRFLNSRTQGKGTKLLSAITGNDFYRSDEVAREGKFINSYVGKIYKSGHTEVLSMGMEKLMSGPVGFAKKDPEHFDLVVDCMRGRFRKGQPTEQRIYGKKQKVRA